MTIDTIAEVGIDSETQLYLRPTSKRFPYIYREAVDVHWNPKLLHLHSLQPRDWTYLQWFQHIIGAAALQSVDLRLTDSTVWTSIPDGLRAEMQTWFFSKHPPEL
jgi:hypothetical protein